LAHLLAKPVMLALFLFGLTQGALQSADFAALTPRILAALWLGKPLGVLVGAMIGARISAKSWPEGISRMDLALIALLLGMGVSVPLLAVETVLPAGLPADQVRIGLASSLAIGLVAVALGRALGRKGMEPRDRTG
jgi:NhaA family Na+:H+ antiporter